MAKIVLTTHQKGGVGKSALTFNLANNFKENAKVCIVDMDYQGSLLNIRELSEVSIFNADKFEEIRNADYDFIFVDTPPYLTQELEKLYTLADVIIIPTKAGILDLLAIKSTVDMVQRSENENKALIVFNMIKPNTSLTEEIKKKVQDFPIKVAKTMISDLVAFSRSVVVNGVEDSQNAQKQIDNLSIEILTFSMQ